MDPIPNQLNYYQGTYVYTPSNQSLKHTTTITVIFNRQLRLEVISIEGRPETPFEIWKEKNKKTEHTRHIIGVELIKLALNRRLRGSPLQKFDATQNCVTARCDAAAKEIFEKEFKTICCDKNNLFNARKDENEGSGAFMLKLKDIIYQGEGRFKPLVFMFKGVTQEEKNILAFLAQIPELDQFTIPDGEKNETTYLPIDNWEMLCFLYENTLIDYASLRKEHNISTYLPTIKEGQKMIDEIFHFKTNYRKSLMDRIDRIVTQQKRKWEGIFTPRQNTRKRKQLETDSKENPNPAKSARPLFVRPPLTEIFKTGTRI